MFIDPLIPLNRYYKTFCSSVVLWTTDPRWSSGNVYTSETFTITKETHDFIGLLAYTGYVVDVTLPTSTVEFHLFTEMGQSVSSDLGLIPKQTIKLHVKMPDKLDKFVQYTMECPLGGVEDLMSHPYPNDTLIKSGGFKEGYLKEIEAFHLEVNKALALIQLDANKLGIPGDL